MRVTNTRRHHQKRDDISTPDWQEGLATHIRTLTPITYPFAFTFFITAARLKEPGHCLHAYKHTPKRMRIQMPPHWLHQVNTLAQHDLAWLHDEPCRRIFISQQNALQQNRGQHGEAMGFLSDFWHAKPFIFDSTARRNGAWGRTDCVLFFAICPNRSFPSTIVNELPKRNLQAVISRARQWGVQTTDYLKAIVNGEPINFSNSGVAVMRPHVHIPLFYVLVSK